MRLLKDLNELLEAGVITQDIAEGIEAHYRKKESGQRNRLFVIFGVLGALLVGLGIILILAHNWDELSRATKTIVAFLPLVIGQALCAYTLMRRQDNLAWREGATVFLIFAVGASISLISQIYNIPGDLGSFYLIWSVLTLPLIYVMNSSMASLLYLVGITCYACETGYWSSPSSEPYLYWLLLACGLPHYYLLAKTRPGSNFTIFHHWIVPLSLIIVLGTVAKGRDELMFVAYFALFGLLYQLGQEEKLTTHRVLINGYKVMGSLGTLVLLLIMSFDDFWPSLREEPFNSSWFLTPEFAAAAVISLIAGALLHFRNRGRVFREIEPLTYVFLIYIVIFIIGNFFKIAVVLINLLVLIVAIERISEGVKRQHLGILNFGLMIIVALVISRFFDTDLSFVFRGLLFVTVGVGFFLANYWLLKKIKANED